MPHTYATISQANAYLASNGGTAIGTATSEQDLALSLLEAASRRVESWCDRSRFGSGFGPRIASNRYDGRGIDLDLQDDFVSLTVTMLDGTGGANVPLTVETDYYLWPYDTTPKREVRFNGVGESPASGLRIFTVAGTAGYSNDTTALGGSLQLASSSATAGTLTAGSVSPGATILTGSEHVYVTAATGGTALTIVRGQNGTTAAAGTAAASTFSYPDEVVTATLAIFQRRWQNRNAGATGDFGFGATGMPTFSHKDSERSLLLAHVGHLRKYGAG